MNTLPSWIEFLPHVLASFNAGAVILLVSGFLAIRNGNRAAHRAIMIAALVVSVDFLLVYGIYHAHVGNVKFAGEGPIRTFYFALLISHVLLAIINLPMIIMTAWRALKGRFDAHRALARYTAAVWLYVSLSGLAVYGMAFHLYSPLG